MSTKKIQLLNGASIVPQSDWTQTDNTKADYIKNKPAIPSSLADLSDDATHRVVTDSEKSEWNEKATIEDINTRIASLVNSAPETLDTLDELAAALGDDANFAATITEQIGKKVDKEDGKRLSTNDYTTAEKDKLAAISDGAEVNQNTFSTIRVNEAAISATDKTDTLNIKAGSNVTLAVDEANKTITISSQGGGSGEGGGIITETDPTVPDWAKADSKPTYTVSEIDGLEDRLNDLSVSAAKEVYIGSGNMPDGYVLQIDPTAEPAKIPTKTSELTNDSGYITISDIPSGAEGNVIDSITLNGVSLAPDENKNVNIEAISSIKVNHNGLETSATVTSGQATISITTPENVVESIQVGEETISPSDTSGVLKIKGDGDASVTKSPNNEVVVSVNKFKLSDITTENSSPSDTDKIPLITASGDQTITWENLKNLLKDKVYCIQGTILSSGWTSSDTKYINSYSLDDFITSNGLTNDSVINAAIFISPAPDSIETWSKYGVYCNSIAENSTDNKVYLGFVAGSNITTNLNFNIEMRFV